MQIALYIPDKDIPKRQDVLTVDFVFIDGHISQCDYPFEELPKGHGRLVDESEVVSINESDGKVWCEAPTIIEADKTESEQNDDIENMLERLWNDTIRNHCDFYKAESEDKE